MPCALCSSSDGVAAWPVPGPKPAALDLCATCRDQITGAAPIDPKHWYCLREAIWSETPAVQVVSWRMLGRLRGEGWASDLLDQVYLDEDTMAWAEAGVEAEPEAEAAVRTVDSNGAVLADGDTVTLIKDLDVKGAGFTAKRGTVVKGIRLGDDPELVEGKVNGIAIFLKTIFLKKVV